MRVVRGKLQFAEGVAGACRRVQWGLRAPWYEINSGLLDQVAAGQARGCPFQEQRMQATEPVRHTTISECTMVILAPARGSGICGSAEATAQCSAVTGARGGAVMTNVALRSSVDPFSAVTASSPE